MHHYLTRSIGTAALAAAMLAAGCGGGGGASGGGGAAPLPSVPEVVPASGVPAAKKLFASLRTNTQAWTDSAQGSGKLATQYSAVRSDFDNAAAAPLDDQLLTWAQLSASGLDYFASFKAGAVSVPVLTLSGGTCTVTSDAAATVKATTAASAVNVICVALRTGAYLSGPMTSQTYVSLGSEIVLTPVAGQAGNYTYAARATRGTVTYGGNTNLSAKTTVGRYGSSEAARATGTVAYSKSGTELASFSINGMMPARMNNQGVALTDYEMWKLDTVRTTLDGGVVSYALSGELSSWLGGAAVGKVTVNNGSFARMLEDKHDGVDNLLREISLSVTAETGHSKINGTIHLENYTADKNGRNFAPAKMTFTGNVGNNDVQFFSGTLGYDTAGYAQFNSDLAVSASNFVKLTTAVSGTITIANRPPLVLSYTLINDTPTATRETAQYSDGTLTINASSVTTGSAASVISIASSDGVSVTLTGADTADVLKDGVKVAVINVKTGVVTYTDGTFESIK